MATTRRGDSKGALSRQRADLRRSARGKVHVGDAAAQAAAGKAAELARVHALQAQNARRLAEEAHRQEPLALLAAELLAEEAHRQEPLALLAAELLADALRLARTLVAFPFRAAQALRGQRHAEA